MTEEDVIQSLKVHLGLELQIIEFYQKYVTQANNPAARQILLQLINESMGHADAVRKLLYKRTLGINIEKQGMSDVALSNLLEIGMKEERGMRLRYEEELKRLDDEEYAELLKKIIEDERRHEAMLKQVYSQLK